MKFILWLTPLEINKKKKKLYYNIYKKIYILNVIY